MASKKEQKRLEEMAREAAAKEYYKKEAEEKAFHVQWYAKPDGGHWDETKDYIEEWGKFNGYTRNEIPSTVARFYKDGRMHPEAGPSKRPPPPGTSSMIYPKINGALIGITTPTTTPDTLWNMTHPHDGQSTPFHAE